MVASRWTSRTEDCVDVTDGTTDRLQLLLVPGTVATHRRRTDEFRPV